MLPESRSTGVAERADLFRRDPVAFLDQVFPDAGDAFRLPDGHLCVAEPEAARAVLANSDGHYREHSDFFTTRRGLFGPRPVQVAIRRGSLALLRSFVSDRSSELGEAVRRELAPSSRWPDAGNWLIYRHLRSVLVHPDTPGADRLRRRLDQVVTNAVLAGARGRRSRVARAVFRFQVRRHLVRAIEERRRRTEEPRDLLGIVVGSAPPDTPAADLGEVFLSFLFAVAGSVGFTLGWSLYLLGTDPAPDAEDDWIVREALRLWPIAWMLGRHPARPHEVAGHPVTPRDLVVVCPYLVHRHPRHWEEPDRFLPERWHGLTDQRAFIPFGWGPHTCVAGALTLQLVGEIVGIVRESFHVTITTNGARPTVAAALAPPKFGLSLAPRHAVRRTKGGELHGEDGPGRQDGPDVPARLW